jgi:chromosomal replication initiator protein
MNRVVEKARAYSPALELAFGRRLTVLKIQQEVAEFYGLHPKVMRDTDRSIGAREPRLSHPRQVAMYLARKLTRMSTPDIGRRFGGRDHSTVLHALKAVEKRAADDPYLELEIEVLRERLSS